MLTAKRIRDLFMALNDELAKKNVIGEVGICGGAVMCLVFQTRKATKDIDAIFEPTREIRVAAKKIAQTHNLPEDWLNDAAKAFFETDPPRENVMSLANLRVWAPGADYMLAMKAVSARFDSHDRDDLIFLIGKLDIKTPKKVFNIIAKYYPRREVPAKTRFLVEEILGAAPPRSKTIPNPIRG